MSEQSLVSARATVMTYDDMNKKWIPSGTSSGLSKVHIYQHPINNTFRVVGWKIQDHEVVINCAILKGLKYIQATPTFHQWRDNRKVYGLNFNNKEEAELFALAMLRTLSILGQSIAQNHWTSSHHVQPLYQTIGHSGVSLDDYAEYKGRVNNEIIDRKSSSQDYVQYTSNSVNHVSHPTTPGSIPSPGISGHHRTSSAPPISLTPVGSMHVSTSPSAPPPPPPPPPSSADLCGLLTLPRQTTKSNPSPVTLASALATAKLKKTPEKLQTDSTDSRVIPAIGGMASMMDEMTRTLARRRAQAENSLDPDGSSTGTEGGKAWDKQGTGNGLSPNKNSGLESPQTLHKLKMDASGDGDKLHLVDAFDMERMKQDIMTEIKKEMNKMKQDIIDVIRSELNRR